MIKEKKVERPGSHQVPRTDVLNTTWVWPTGELIGKWWRLTKRGQRWEHLLPKCPRLDAQEMNASVTEGTEDDSKLEEKIY